MEKLKTQMAQVEKDNKVLQELHAELDRDRKEQMTEQYRRYARALLEANNPEAGCACKPPCPPPFQPGLLPPTQRAMLPTEIPLKIPATMEVVFENAEFEEARIRNLPTQPAKIPCKPKCKKPCGRGGHRDSKYPQPPPPTGNDDTANPENDGDSEPSQVARSKTKLFDWLK